MYLSKSCHQPAVPLVLHQGYRGGMPGAFGRIEASTGEVFERKGVRDFPPGTEVTLSLPGGGGFYDPFSRDPQAVLEDVRDGIVSVAAAREHYGVAIDEAAMAVDDTETSKLRAAHP